MYLLCNEDGCHTEEHWKPCQNYSCHYSVADGETVVVILLALPEALADGGETQGLDRGGWERLNLTCVCIVSYSMQH